VLVKLGADLSRVRQQVIQVQSGYAGGEDVGTRMLLVRITVPDDLREIEEQLAQVRQKKEAAIQAQDFEKAATLRDQEEQLLPRQAEREREWTAGVDLAAVIEENHKLHGEVERLRELLGRHGIEPDGGAEEPA
jgi:hypothetical protein